MRSLRSAFRDNADEFDRGVHPIDRIAWKRDSNPRRLEGPEQERIPSTGAFVNALANHVPLELEVD